MKHKIYTFESLNELILVKINGSEWFVDWYNKKLYTDKNRNSETDFNNLTSNEIEQIRNQIFYSKPMISY
jgi:hypothetical protein